jgi:spoIIIJ-associated protein
MKDELKPITQKEIKVAKDVIEDFFKKLDVVASAEITASDDSIDVELTTDESGIIIGYHGETLESLQLLLSLGVSKKIGRFIRVLVDVGGYRQQRTEYLTQLASQMKEAVMSENQERIINSLKSWERRVVHMLLKDDPDVITESQGTGRDRVLVVRPR